MLFFLDCFPLFLFVPCWQSCLSLSSIHWACYSIAKIWILVDRTVYIIKPIILLIICTIYFVELQSGVWDLTPNQRSVISTIYISYLFMGELNWELNNVWKCVVVREKQWQGSREIVKQLKGKLLHLLLVLFRCLSRPLRFARKFVQ